MNTSDFRDAFLEEVSEQLTEIEQRIIALEAHGDDDATVQSLFRAAHTLKGSSAAMGFDGMKDLTHEMEHVLDEVRNHRLAPSRDMITLLFQCYDGLRALQDAYINGGGSEVDIEPLAAALRQFVEKGEHVELAPVARTFDGALSEDIRYRLQDAILDGQKAYTVVAQFNGASVMRGVRAYLTVDGLSAIAQVVSVAPTLDEMAELQDEQIPGFQLTLTTTAAPDAVRETMDSPDFAQIDISEMAVVTDPQAVPKMAAPAAATDTRADGPGEKAAPRKSQSIRVDVERLETLINLVGELVIDQARMRRVQRKLEGSYRSDESVRVLADISGHVSRVVSELQENVMAARMLPVEALFDRFPRIVRDVAQSLNKDVQLILEGRETRLDRTVIEEVADPLIHLVRNAVDHGLESADLRVAASKPQQGTVRLAATQEDNKVVISVTDDGAGMDHQKLRKAAVEKGLINQEDADKLSVAEALNLVFRPGFSTASTISDISGRGVGMDIVRSHIEKLNGTIEIHTELGQGTTFRIKLPLTLAIMPGLLVGVNDRTFVIPMTNIVEIVRHPVDSLQSVHGIPSINLRGKVLPIVYLRQFLQMPANEAVPKNLSVVIVESSEKQVGLVVDELHGNQEIVKKSLGGNLGTIDGVVGATILGDGRIGLILDIAGVCRSLAS